MRVFRQRPRAVAPLRRHPARMVNGFKGGDWNDLTQTMNVRQKHAHSWVEAYIGLDAGERPRSGSPSTPLRRPTRGVGRSGRRRRRQLPPADRPDPLRLGLLHRRLRRRPQNRLLYTPMRQMIRMISDRLCHALRTGPGNGSRACSSFQKPSAHSSASEGSSSRSSCWLCSLDRPSAFHLARVLLREWLRGPDRRFDVPHGRHSFLSPAGAVAGRVRPGAHSRRDPGRVRRSRPKFLTGQGSLRSRRVAEVPAASRRRVLPGPVRSPRARSGHSTTASSDSTSLDCCSQARLEHNTREQSQESCTDACRNRRIRRERQEHAVSAPDRNTRPIRARFMRARSAWPRSPTRGWTSWPRFTSPRRSLRPPSSSSIRPVSYPDRTATTPSDWP